MPPKSSQVIDLARLEERIIGLRKERESDRRAFDSHEVKDDERFNKMLGFIKERFDKVDDRLDTLWDDMNTRNGGWDMAKYVAGIVGGLFVIVTEALFQRFHG